MPEPVKPGRRYMPGLDGLRAIAVLAVIAYHLGFGWIPGGLLGVGLFFTLSGYLITDILLRQVAAGRVRLGEFWLARARRLLPALFLMIVVVVAWATSIGPHQPPDFRGGAWSAVFYVNNWWQIFHDVSYFAAFETPEPLSHLWSLSVEEQFYILWPFVLVIGVVLFPDVVPKTGVRVPLALATLGLALASAVLMVILYKPGIDPSRVYYGTDTRAVELLVGAAFAMVWPSRNLRARISEGARWTLDGAGVLGLAVIFLMFWRVDEFSPFLYRGGFVLLSIATVLALAPMTHPASRLALLVGARPMRWIGERSYGIYLWHFPIIILTTPAGATGVNLARAAAQVAATIGIAALSWRYVENPIRHGALGRLLRRGRDANWRPPRFSIRGSLIAAACSMIAIFAIGGLAGAGTGPSRAEEPGNITVAETLTAADPAPEASADRTVCDAVVHIGDSTSEGLVSEEYLPDPKQLIASQYGRVGATTQHLEVSGARSIYETFEGASNAEDVARYWVEKGFEGCWVFALGTNEAANVAAGSAVGYDKRIDTMMAVAGEDPVLWVNVKSLVTDGPYASPNMQLWDAALLDACDRYPTMRIYDWANEVKDAWFIDDGIHFTTPGYAARGRRIAEALLTAFPASGGLVTTDSSSCLVRSQEESPATAAPSTETADETAISASVTGGLTTEP